MARIVTVYHQRREPFVPENMALIRWMRMSEALAGQGHTVDMATLEPAVESGPIQMSVGLRRISLKHVQWKDYDAVKTLFHLGFDTLAQWGGLDHPFLISSLGSVVGDTDMGGVYFFGERRKWLFEVQVRMARRGGVVSILTRESIDLWRRMHGDSNVILQVPGATEAEVPAPGPDPYPDSGRPRCVYSGNIYTVDTQAEAHWALIDRLNRLGRALDSRGIRLFVVGNGSTGGLDPDCVSHLGAVPYHQSWDYLWHAGVGIVLAFGPEMNHNESTKIYYYLRCGLPVVCEASYPNQGLIEAARLGRVSPNGDMEAMAVAIEQCIDADWDRRGASEYMKREHTWAQRARIYKPIFNERLGPS